MSVVELDVPRTLPVDYLSASSVSTYLRCSESWRRRYLEREYEAPNGYMVLGSAVHAAESHADSVQIDTASRPDTELVQDVFADEWTERTDREEVDWGERKPGELKDAGVGVIAAYDRDVAPSLRPVCAEREFNLTLDGVDWGFKGFIDLEQADGSVDDRKVRGTKMSAAVADSELSVAPYLLARRAEGNPASVFRFHTLVRTKQPYAELVPTVRTDRQLDAFVDRLYGIAAEINWRMSSEVWSGAVPGSYWCSERFCGYWSSCPMGGER